MSQARVAELFDLSQASYSKMEAGGTDVSLSTLARAADITELPLAALLGVQTFPEPSTAQMMQALVDAGYTVTKAAQASPPKS